MVSHGISTYLKKRAQTTFCCCCCANSRRLSARYDGSLSLIEERVLATGLSLKMSYKNDTKGTPPYQVVLPLGLSHFFIRPRLTSRSQTTACVPTVDPVRALNYFSRVFRVFFPR